MEEEGGRLIYSFDVRLGDGGLFEVEVDAITGEAMNEEADDADADDDDEDEDGEGHEDDDEGHV